jgi:hypothetical protein
MYTFVETPADVRDLPEYLRKTLLEIEDALNTPEIFVSEHFTTKESSVNTRLKREGLQVWDSTSKKPVWATGKAPEDDWIFGDGTVAYSPVSSIIKP